MLNATQRWRLRNPEKVKAQRNTWAARNKKRILSYRKKPYACYTTERRRKTYKNNMENEKRTQRSCTLKRLYGISIADYENMAKMQDGLCTICYKLPGIKGLVVDHDHSTGLVRDLLCATCNSRLGVLENKDWIVKATAYLERHGRTN